jgi:hypothetical protein
MLGSAAVPVVVLIVAVAGIGWFSRGLTAIHTTGMLVCGAVAGAALAAWAVQRSRARR